MEIIETPIPEKGVHGEGAFRTDTKEGAVFIGARAQMGNAPQKFIGVPFLLEGICLWVCRSHQAHMGRLDFPPLPFARGLDQGPLHLDGSTRGDACEAPIGER